MGPPTVVDSEHSVSVDRDHPLLHRPARTPRRLLVPVGVRGGDGGGRSLLNSLLLPLLLLLLLLALALVARRRLWLWVRPGRDRLVRHGLDFSRPPLGRRAAFGPGVGVCEAGTVVITGMAW